MQLTLHCLSILSPTPLHPPPCSHPSLCSPTPRYLHPSHCSQSHLPASRQTGCLLLLQRIRDKILIIFLLKSQIFFQGRCVWNNYLVNSRLSFDRKDDRRGIRSKSVSTTRMFPEVWLVFFTSCTSSSTFSSSASSTEKLMSPPLFCKQVHVMKEYYWDLLVQWIQEKVVDSKVLLCWLDLHLK